MSVQFNEQKLEELIAKASTPKQKAGYQELLKRLKSQNRETKPSLRKVSTQPEPETEPKTEPEPKPEPEPNPKPETMFQAVGIVEGQVSFSESGSTIAFNGKEYPLFYIPAKRNALEALQLEVTNSGNHRQKLIVYPRFLHFPQKDIPHQVSFQLVGFDKGQSKSIAQELQNFEFYLCGLWQFIPVCKVPCVTVQKNFSPERLEYIKQAEPARKARFLKASHLPLFWKDSPVKPFRYNPKVKKEDQGQAAFIQVKARFLPGRDMFGFVEQLAEPMEAAPKFLKLSKEDKAKALQAKPKI